MNRRQFLNISMAATAGAMILPSCLGKSSKSLPSYLKGYDDLYATDPRKATIEWFKNAEYGMFIHYGLYSILGRHEWVMRNEKIHVAEYDKLKDQFTAEKVDADFITDLAL